MSNKIKSTMFDALALVVVFVPLLSAFVIGGKMNGWN